jgi:hypothetical protein
MPWWGKRLACLKATMCHQPVHRHAGARESDADRIGGHGRFHERRHVCCVGRVGFHGRVSVKPSVGRQLLLIDFTAQHAVSQ